MIGVLFRTKSQKIINKIKLKQRIILFVLLHDLHDLLPIFIGTVLKNIVEH